MQQSFYKADKKVYNPREKVLLDISVIDINGNPVAGNFSLSVSDASQVVEVEKYNDNFSLQYNSDNTFVLCLKRNKKTEPSPFPSINYFVYDIKGEILLFEEAIDRGDVKWINDFQIKISTIPGIVKGDEKNEGKGAEYIYDLKLKKKIFNSSARPVVDDSK